MSNKDWMDLNRVELRGKLTKDPVFRVTTTGKTVASFSIPTSWGKTEEDRKRNTVWHNISTFNETHIETLRTLKKDDRIHLTGGEIRSRKYTGADGVERTVTEINLGNFETTLALVPDDRQTPRAPSRAAAVARGGDDADEIPF